MFLLINTGEKDCIHLALFDEEKVDERKEQGENREILRHIEAFLMEKNVQKEEIRGIAVVVASGSFTSTRLAATVANTWSYARQIPVLAISVQEVNSLCSLIPLFLSQQTGQYISPTYSGEPNIGS